MLANDRQDDRSRWPRFATIRTAGFFVAPFVLVTAVMIASALILKESNSQNVRGTYMMTRHDGHHDPHPPGALGDPSVHAVEHVTLERLRESGYGALRDVSCLAAKEILLLEGRLPSYYLKQVAQEIAMRAGGRFRVVNLITVSRGLSTPDRILV